MSSTSTECTSGPRICNNYFDGLPVTGFHKAIFFIIMMAYFFEQMDNWNFGFIAPAIFKSWGLDKTASNQTMALIMFWYFIGMTAGGFLGGIISDIIGRRKTFLFSMVLFSAGSIINGLPIDSMTVFIAARTLTGFGVFCLMVCSQAYIAEMAPCESRGKWQGLVAAVGFCAVPVIAFICRLVIPMSPEAWRWIFYFGGIGFLGLIVAHKYLLESPRWLLAQGRKEEAEAIVRKVSGRDIDLSEAAKSCTPRESILECIYGMFAPQYLGRTLLILALFLTITPAGFTFTSWTAKLLSNLPALDAAGAPLLDAAGKAVMLYTPQDMLTIMTIVSCGVPAGCFLASRIADLGGRKWPLFGTAIAAAVMAFLLSQNAGHFWGAAICGFLLSVFNLACNFILFSYTAESYPTRIRNTATGLQNGIARLSVSGFQMIMPFVLLTVGNMVGSEFTGVFVTVAVLFVLAMPLLAIFGKRTSGKSLEDIS